jgi:prepilin-type N-terminal cleavage/methylation domain-containing protein
MEGSRRVAGRQGFTLVEILIVVMVLGILAAVVVPQFSYATDEARAGAIRTQLRHLQNQIELDAARNKGAYPIASMAPNWELLRTGGSIKADPINPAQPAGGIVSRTSLAFVDNSSVRGSANAAWLWNQPSLVAVPLVEVITGPDPTPALVEFNGPFLCASYFNETTGQVTSTATD